MPAILLIAEICIFVFALWGGLFFLKEAFYLIFKNTESRGMLFQSTRTQYGMFFPFPWKKSEGFYQEILTQAQPYLSLETKALDVGCGPGRLVFEYEKLGAKRSVGSDNSKQYIRFCKKMQSGKPDFSFTVPMPNTSEFIYSDILSDTKIKPSSFDLISCINVYDRVKDTRELFASLHRIAKPGAILIITTPYDWIFSPAPKELQFPDMKQAFSTEDWSIEKEIRNIPYTIPIGKDEERAYLCHMLVLRKN